MSFDVERFARVLLHTMPDAVIYADAKGIIQFWNAGAERIFGFGPSEALGQSLDIIIPRSFKRSTEVGEDVVPKSGNNRRT